VAVERVFERLDFFRELLVGFFHLRVISEQLVEAFGDGSLCGTRRSTLSGGTLR